MPSFHEVRFPEDISYGSKGGPKFSTTIFEASSGAEQRNINWSQTKAEYDISLGIRSRDMMDTARAFFMARRGRAYGFRFKDWGDFQIANQQIGVGNGTTTQFQLVKTYSSGGYTFTRTVKKPVSGSITTVTVNNIVTAAYTVDYTTGIFTMTAAPPNTHPVKVSYIEFDVPCRFDTDHLDAQHDFYETESWPQIKIVEVTR